LKQLFHGHPIDVASEMAAQDWGIEMADMVARKNVPACRRRSREVDDFRFADEKED
jgi:hypothetical protein